MIVPMRTFVAPRPAHFVRRLTTATALASLGLLTACGGGSEPDEPAADNAVASVATPSSTPSQTAVQAERPLIRPDTTKEEEGRLWDVYLDCQAQHGLANYMIKNEDGSWKGYKGGNDKLYNAALKACASKEPQTLPDRVAKEDPNWKDKYRQWISCMQSHGIAAEPSWDSPGYFALTDGRLPTVSQEKWVKKCEADAYVAK
jgi:hypothetical protein